MFRDMSSLRYEYQISRDADSSGARIYRIITPGTYVLDVGCSTGFLGRALNEKNCRCIGIEIDHEAAEIAKTHYEKVMVGDVLSVLGELENEQFDFIVLADILEHLSRPDELLIRLDHFLAKDGELLISLPNITHISVACELLKGRFHYRDTGLLDLTHLRFFDRSSALELLQESGYSGIIVETVSKEPLDTEFETRLAEFPPETIAVLNSNPDARVYQFIIRAVPFKRIHSLGQAEALRRDLAEAESALNTKSAGIDSLGTELAEADSIVSARSAKIVALRGDLADAEVVRQRLCSDLEMCRMEIDRIHAASRWRIGVRLSHIKRRPRELIAEYSRYMYWLLTFQLRKRLKEKRLTELIAQSSLFDNFYYLEGNPDVARAGIDPLVHYLTWGAAEGRNPNPSFDTSYYLKSNPDVARAGVNPLVHYLAWGAAEGRDPSPLFDTSFYLESNPDVARAGINPLSHYLTWGAAEGREPVAQGGMLSTSLNTGSLDARYSSCPARIPAPSHTAETLAEALREFMTQSRFVVALSHDNYVKVVGGVQIFVSDEQRICNDNGIGQLHFFPTNPRPKLANPEEPFYVSINCNGRFVTECQADIALEALNQLVHGPLRKTSSWVILHQLLGFNIEWVRRLVEEIGKGKALFWVHDFFVLCPCYTLMRNDIAYCDAPPIESGSCQICIYGEERARHVQAFHDLFKRVDLTIVAPSNYVERMWNEKGNYRAVGIRVMPYCHLEWDETNRPTQRHDLPQSRLRVGFLGMPRHHKGWTTWKQIVKRFGSDPRYQFFHFSTIRDNSPNLTYIPVSVSPDNRQAMSDALRTQNIDVVFLWSVWPETFCFTLYEAMVSGCYVVTNAYSGNVQHTVSQTHCGAVLATEQEAVSWFESDRLIKAAREFRNQKARFGSLLLTPGSYKIIFEKSE
ncbi:MAG: methyltransferase domain-containing protein [Syntrophobacteraceae bacterium]